MDESQLDELFNNVKEKIGEENYALISDDVLNIRSGLITQINDSKEKDKYKIVGKISKTNITKLFVKLGENN